EPTSSSPTYRPTAEGRCGRTIPPVGLLNALPVGRKYAVSDRAEVVCPRGSGRAMSSTGEAEAPPQPGHSPDAAEIDPPASSGVEGSGEAEDGVGVPEDVEQLPDAELSIPDPETSTDAEIAALPVNGDSSIASVGSSASSDGAVDGVDRSLLPEDDSSLIMEDGQLDES
ncbi:unnamed protein product, partial [Discosporangium mesarthrocarpum]